MPKIIRKYVNNRIKKSRILPPKHELYSRLKTDLDGNQVVQGLLWLVFDHGVPLQERSLGPVFTIFKFVSFEVCPLLLVRGSKEREWMLHLPIFFFFSEQSSNYLFFLCRAIQGAEWLQEKTLNWELSPSTQYTERRIRPLLLFDSLTMLEIV